MTQSLPERLLDAESQIYDSLISFLEVDSSNRISINLNFEGLKLIPLATRLYNKLADVNIKVKLIWADAGATALAKRDSPAISNDIKSYKDILQEDIELLNNNLLIIISPQPYDYEEFVSICNKYEGRIIMINGKLDDSAVGIGSVARQRRKEFISKWKNIYWLEPLKEGALMHSFPLDWLLYKFSSDGYNLHETFKNRPDSEMIFESFLKK